MKNTVRFASDYHQQQQQQQQQHSLPHSLNNNSINSNLNTSNSFSSNSNNNSNNNSISGNNSISSNNSSTASSSSSSNVYRYSSRITSPSPKTATIERTPAIHSPSVITSIPLSAINEDPTSLLFTQHDMKLQIESLKQEVTRYKLNLAELVDEINFAESQLAEKDKIIEDLKLASLARDDTNASVSNSTASAVSVSSPASSPDRRDDRNRTSPPKIVVVNEDMSNQIMRLESENKSQQQTIEQLQRELDELGLRYESCRQENELIEEENHNLSTELSSLYAEKQRAIVELERAKMITHTLGSPSLMEQEQTQMLNRTIANLKDQIDNLTETNALLMEETKYLNQTIEQRKQEHEELTQEKQQLITALQSNGELSHFLNNSAETAASFEKTILSFREKLQEANMDKEEEYSTLIKTQELRIMQLVEDNEKLQSELDEHRSQYEQVMTELDEQTKRADQYASNIGILKSQFEDLKAQWESKKNGGSSSADTAERDRLLSEISIMREDNTQMEKINSMLRSKIDSLTQQVEKSLSVEESFETEKRQIEDTNKKLKLSYVKARRLEDEITRLRNEIESKNRERQDLSQALSQEREKVTALQAKLEESQEAAQLKSTVEALERQLKQKEKDFAHRLETVHKEKEFLIKETKQSEQVIEELKNEIEHLLVEMRNDSPAPSEQLGAIMGDLQLAKSKIQNQNESIEDTHRSLTETKEILVNIRQVLDVMIQVVREEMLTEGSSSSSVGVSTRHGPSSTASKVMIGKLNEVSQSLNRNLQFADLKLQLNTSVDYARSLTAKLEEKESLLDQAIQYVSEVQQEYDKIKEQLELSENDRLQLEAQVSEMTKKPQKIKRHP